ncbi:MAG: ABC transporter permease, partial [Oscillospiraceae bacterium]
MQSVKSYFNPTLFRKNITRFWPVWAVYLVAWIFALPVSGYLRMANTTAEYLAENRLYFANEMALDMVNGFGVVFALIFGLLAAVCVFSYLYNNRSAGMIHGLPLRREGLFLTNYLSG